MPSKAVKQIVFGGYACAEARAFMARTSGIGGIYRQQQIKAINRLVACGVWPKLDILYFFATQDGTNALLNAVSSSFAATLAGTPTFTVGQGYTGLVTGSNHVVGPNENALTQFQRDSAHISAWSWVGQSANAAIVHSNGIQRLNPNNAGTGLCRINCSAGAAGGTPANAGRGYCLGNRTGSASFDFYENGLFIDNDTTASVAPGAFAFHMPQSTSVRGPISIVTIGGDVAAYQGEMYAIFADYMRALGATVP